VFLLIAGLSLGVWRIYKDKNKKKYIMNIDTKITRVPLEGNLKRKNKVLAHINGLTEVCDVEKGHVVLDEKKIGYPIENTDEIEFSRC